jgi:hypothetical protein
MKKIFALIAVAIAAPVFAQATPAEPATRATPAAKDSAAVPATPATRAIPPQKDADEADKTILDDKTTGSDARAIPATPAVPPSKDSAPGTGATRAIPAVPSPNADKGQAHKPDKKQY